MGRTLDEQKEYLITQIENLESLTPHDTLGLDLDANQDTIRERYELLSNFYLPDKNNGNPEPLTKILNNTLRLLDENAKKKILLRKLYNLANDKNGNCLEFLEQIKVGDKLPQWALKAIDDNSSNKIPQLIRILQAINGKINVGDGSITLPQNIQELKKVALWLIKNGADVNAEKISEGSKAGEDNVRPIHLAAQSGDMEILQAILDSNSETINSLDDAKSSPLILLLSGNNCSIECVKLLVEKGAHAHIAMKDSTTCLTAILTNQYINQDQQNEIISYLLAQEGIAQIIDQKMVHSNQNTALHLAVQQENLEALKMLLLKVANKLIENEQKNTPLDLAEKITNEEVKKAIQIALGYAPYPQGATLTDKLQLTLARLKYFDKKNNKWTNTPQIGVETVNFIEMVMVILRDRTIKTNEDLVTKLSLILDPKQVEVTGVLVSIDEDRYQNPELTSLKKELRDLILPPFDRDKEKRFLNNSLHRNAVKTQVGYGDPVKDDDSYLKRGKKQGGLAATGFERECSELLPAIQQMIWTFWMGTEAFPTYI